MKRDVYKDSDVGSNQSGSEHDKLIERLLRDPNKREAVGWLKEVSKGSSDYFVAKGTNIDAATISVKPTATEKNKRRRRHLIREHWRVHDTQRFNAISEVFSRRAGL